MEAKEENIRPPALKLSAEERDKFVNAFRIVQEYAFRINEAAGWHNPAPTDAECTANVHGEISELNEWLRQGNPASDHIAPFSGAEEEGADAIIRLMNWFKRRDWDLAAAILSKLDYNATRPQRHGGKVF